MILLEKEENEKSSSFWDWTVGIVILVLIGGLTFFYQYQKRSSTTRFHQADELYKAGKLREAGKVYEELKTAQYLTTHDDSIIYARLDSLEVAQERQNTLVSEARKKFAESDTLGAVAELDRLDHKELLAPEDQAWADSARGKSAVASKP